MKPNEFQSIYEHNKLNRKQVMNLSEEDRHIYNKWRYKISFAKMQEIKMLLSFQEYWELVKDAKILASQIGRDRGTYQLGRYNDSGNYEKGNCRFITIAENNAERKISNKQREANSESAIRMNKLLDPKIRSKNGKKVCKLWASLPRTEKQLQTSSYNGKLMNHKKHKHKGKLENCRICYKGKEN